MYTETERQRDSPFRGDVETPFPPKHPNLSNPPHQKQHLQSPAKGVLIFSTGILLLRGFRSPKKWEKSGKKHRKKTKKFVNFSYPHGKGSSSHLRQTHNCCITQIKMSEWTKKPAPLEKQNTY